MSEEELSCWPRSQACGGLSRGGLNCYLTMQVTIPNPNAVLIIKGRGCYDSVDSHHSVWSSHWSGRKWDRHCDGILK